MVSDDIGPIFVQVTTRVILWSANDTNNENKKLWKRSDNVEREPSGRESVWCNWVRMRMCLSGQKRRRKSKRNDGNITCKQKWGHKLYVYVSKLLNKRIFPFILSIDIKVASRELSVSYHGLMEGTRHH